MKFIVLAAFYCLLVAGCKKAKEPVVPAGPQMPARTETGANILACKVNGEVHIYRGKHSSTRHDGVDFFNISSPTKYILITADDTDYDDDIEMKLYAADIKLNVAYSFSEKDSKDLGTYYTGQGAAINTYKTKDAPGFVKFSRFDSNVVAGSFEFQAFNPEGKKVELTEGFFDISRKE